jgi:outer membrane cobalamin receptor
MRQVQQATDATNAVGGVIQIFTRDARVSGGSVAAELGTQGHRKIAANASLVTGGTSLWASDSRSVVKGISAENPRQTPLANPDSDGSQQTTGALGISIGSIMI